MNAPVSDWIEWAGGKCPVSNPDAEVEVRFRNGLTVTDCDAWEWNWADRGQSLDIIAYRVVQP